MRGEVYLWLALIGGVLAAVWLALLAHVLVARRNARRRLAALIEERVTTALVAGPATIVGDVVGAPSDIVAKLTITQSGRRRSRKRARWTDWTETGRRLQSQSFAIRTSPGIVTVETASLAIRSDELVRVEHDSAVRTCSATIAGGDRVTATGHLVSGGGDGAYRSTGRWTLAASDGRVILSTVRAATRDTRLLDLLGRTFRAIGFGLGFSLAGPLAVMACGDHFGRVVAGIAGRLLLAAVFFTLVGPVAYVAGRRELRPWWERSRLNETSPGWPNRR